ncbi:hypothetical protein ZOSMA_425G00150 [Zostera marina]|uniref:DUF679 domain membrane protein n=1 Tax=Zostera marina TaxID=29655 RepID=A0A0K9P286_ZOSMR|nr:hypothetical protein ZOSMA_425G00150 [Zostera marina]
MNTTEIPQLYQIMQVRDPLLPSPKSRLTEQVISRTFKSVAHLANLLPTGTVLAFQLLSPVFTNQGQCDYACRYMTCLLITLCAASCLLLSFTDSFTDEQGVVRYGFATLSGLWVINGDANAAPLPKNRLNGYRIQFIDFLHALMSVMVFAAVAMFDKNVVACFYPVPSTETEEVLTMLPIGIGVFASFMFLVFPTTRHGIGFPVSDK